MYVDDAIFLYRNSVDGRTNFSKVSLSFKGMVKIWIHHSEVLDSGIGNPPYLVQCCGSVKVKFWYGSGSVPRTNGSCYFPH